MVVVKPDAGDDETEIELDVDEATGAEEQEPLMISRSRHQPVNSYTSSSRIPVKFGRSYDAENPHDDYGKSKTTKIYNFGASVFSVVKILAF